MDRNDDYLSTTASSVSSSDSNDLSTVNKEINDETIIFLDHNNNRIQITATNTLSYDLTHTSKSNFFEIDSNMSVSNLVIKKNLPFTTHYRFEII